MGPAQIDPDKEYIGIGFGNCPVEYVPVPDGVTQEAVDMDALEEFRRRVVEGCKHPGSPCERCRAEVVNGVAANLQKAARSAP